MARDFMLKQFIGGSCYSYILSSQDEALIIDPHISLLDAYAGYLKKKHLRLKYIVDTHTHADHFSLASILKKSFNVPVIMHEKAVSDVADRRVKEGDEILFGSTPLKVIYTPGHTDDSITLFGEGKLFTADVLLIESVGRTDFQNGSPESMFETLAKLKTLPDETIIFPAHDYNEKRSSSIGREKQTNPFLKETSKEVFAQNMRAKKLKKPFNMDNIVRVNQKGEAASLEMIPPKDAQALASKDPQIKFLDVRSALEFSEAHIKDSINIPMDMLSAKINELSQAKEKYIVTCRTGTRSTMAADMLTQAGMQSIKVMYGGLLRWQKERLPVIKGKTVISLERQVRIIAGSLVLLGVILGWIVNSAFIWISVWVSCGLIFAGITNNCLMGMLLMKLPHNKGLYKTKTGGGTCSMS